MLFMNSHARVQSLERFVTATPSDIPLLMELYEKGSQYQKEKFGKGWQFIDTDRVETEIRESRLWKIVEDDAIACIFSVVYSDPLLWQERNEDAAVYIHRIVTNPDFRGRGYVTKITDWAKEHAHANELKYVRLDTWEDNLKLAQLYVSNGFEPVGRVLLNETDSVPKHYIGNAISLFQIDLQSDRDRLKQLKPDG